MINEFVKDSMSFMKQASYVSEGFKGCSPQISDTPVKIEPYFTPYSLMDFGKNPMNKEDVPICVPADEEVELQYIKVWFSKNPYTQNSHSEIKQSFINQLCGSCKQIRIHVGGNSREISFVIGVRREDVFCAKNAILSAFQDSEIETLPTDYLKNQILCGDGELFFVEYFTPVPYWGSLTLINQQVETPLFQAISTGLTRSEYAFFDVITTPCEGDWNNNIYSLSIAEKQGGVPVHVIRDWKQAGFGGGHSDKVFQKVNLPILATLIRVGAVCKKNKRANVLRSMSQGLNSAFWRGQRLSHIKGEDYKKVLGQDGMLEMVVKAKSYRAGSLFSLDELSSLIPIPLPHDIMEGRYGISTSTQKFSKSLSGSDGVFVGDIMLAGKTKPYFLSDSYRARGIEIRGTIGSGKSNQIVQMFLSDIERRKRLAGKE